MKYDFDSVNLPKLNQVIEGKVDVSGHCYADGSAHIYSDGSWIHMAKGEAERLARFLYGTYIDDSKSGHELPLINTEPNLVLEEEFEEIEKVLKSMVPEWTALRNKFERKTKNRPPPNEMTEKDTIISTSDSEAAGLSGRQYNNGSIDIWYNSGGQEYEGITITKKALPKVIEFLKGCQIK